MITSGWHLLSRAMNLRVRLLLGVCALLSMALVTELLVFAGTDSAIESGAAEKPSKEQRHNLPAPPAVRTEALIAYRETLRRPLFTPLRQAQSGSSGGTGAREQIASRWRLTGVVLNAGTTFAILQPRASGAAARPLKLQPGASLDGWELKVIASDHITLASGRETFELRLHEPLAATSQAAAAPNPAVTSGPRRTQRQDAQRAGAWTPAN